MNKRSLGVLVVINFVLLSGLAVTFLAGQRAQAQFGLQGDYMMIAGEVTGRAQQAAVYILDLKSQRMATVMFDSRNQRLQLIAGRNVSNDLEARHGR